MDLGITGRTALISGADSGIGWETARILLGEGVRVVLTDKDQKSLDAAAAGLGAADEGSAAGDSEVHDNSLVMRSLWKRMLAS